MVIFSVSFFFPLLEAGGHGISKDLHFFFLGSILTKANQPSRMGNLILKKRLCL